MPDHMNLVTQRLMHKPIFKASYFARTRSRAHLETLCFKGSQLDVLLLPIWRHQELFYLSVALLREENLHSYGHLYIALDYEGPSSPGFTSEHKNGGANDTKKRILEQNDRRSHLFLGGFSGKRI